MLANYVALNPDLNERQGKAILTSSELKKDHNEPTSPFSESKRLERPAKTIIVGLGNWLVWITR